MATNSDQAVIIAVFWYVFTGVRDADRLVLRGVSVPLRVQTSFTATANEEVVILRWIEFSSASRTPRHKRHLADHAQGH